MLCDTHTHLAAYSHDAKQTIDELLACAAQNNLSAVCITDHYEKDLFTMVVKIFLILHAILPI